MQMKLHLIGLALDHDTHEKLRLHAKKTDQTRQAILEAALDQYLKRIVDVPVEPGTFTVEEATIVTRDNVRVTIERIK